MNFHQTETSSSLNIKLWDTYSQTGTWVTNSVIEYMPRRMVPKFQIGSTIVYFSYLKWSKKIAIHKIHDIRDNLYIFISPYNNEEYTMECEKTDTHFMEYNDCLEKFPELFIGA